MCNIQGLPRGSDIRVLQESHDIDIDDDNIGSTEIRPGGEPSSACLWAMVNDFLEVDTPAAACIREDHITSRSGSFFSSSCANTSDAILKRAIQEMESMIGSSGHDGIEAKIASCVAKALKAKNSMVGIESGHNERSLPGVLKHLQREAYDAGLCATARKPSNAGHRFLPTGGHWYIDVIVQEIPVSGTFVGKRSTERLIVDVGFCAHFEIARPLPAYQKLIAMLPSTFIGKAALLQRVVRIMSQAARASLESQDMHIPPWRSFSFLLAKWFSPTCTRVTSFDEAKHIVLNTSLSTNHIKPCVFAELNYNSDSANFLAHPPVNKGCKINGPKSVFLQEDRSTRAWYPPPPTNQISVNNNDIDDGISSYTKKRNIVSALALAFGETRHAHIMTECVAASARRFMCNRPQQSAAAESVCDVVL